MWNGLSRRSKFPDKKKNLTCFQRLLLFLFCFFNKLVSLQIVGNFQVSSFKTLQVLVPSYVYYALEFTS